MIDLIQRCQQGDREAMGQLYTAMHDELLARCRKFAANDNVAEDLLHDAFLLIFTNIGKVHSPEKGRGWMHKVTQNVCLLYVQHRQSVSLVPIDEVKETPKGAESDMTVTYEELLKAIDQLPRGYRQVFRLSVIEGMTHQQIAQLTGIDPHTSSSQLLRAKKQLRRLVKLLMLTLLLAGMFGLYYILPLYDGKHDVAEVESTTVGSQKTDSNVLVKDSTDQGHVAAVSSGKILTNVSVSLPDLTDAQASIGDSISEWSDSVKAEAVKAVNDIVVAESPLSADDSVVTNSAVEKEKVVVADIPGTVPQTEKDNNFFLSLAYSGLPNGSARSLPYGAEGMNGDIDTVVHHRLPMTVALNGRYSSGNRWWVDGGIRFSQLSSEMRVGNTYLYMEQQQRVRYLGLSIGVGYEWWHRRHWMLYSTGSVVCELPLHSTVETSYWRGDRLIEAENTRLIPHVQWSVGAGLGAQYDITPAIGLFVEPSLQYHFRRSDGIKTWWSEHPFSPLLPIGIRFSF